MDLKMRNMFIHYNSFISFLFFFLISFWANGIHYPFVYPLVNVYTMLQQYKYEEQVEGKEEIEFGRNKVHIGFYCLSKA